MYRRNVAPNRVIHLHPKPYTQSLDGDFHQAGHPLPGTLAEWRQALPDATFHIHWQGEVYISEPIEGMQIIRSLPTQADYEKWTKIALHDAQQLLPWRSIAGLRSELNQYRNIPLPGCPKGPTKAWQIPQEGYLRFLRNELRSARERHRAVKDKISRGETIDPFSGQHLSIWNLRFRVRTATIEEHLQLLTPLNPQEYRSLCYSNELLKQYTQWLNRDELYHDLPGIAPRLPIKAQTFDVPFYDWIQEGEHPSVVWHWYLELFRPHIPTELWDEIILAFADHISQWATDWQRGDLFDMASAAQDPMILLAEIEEDWKVVPGHMTALRTKINTDFQLTANSCVFNVMDIASYYQTTGAKRLAYLRRRLSYIRRIILPLFRSLSPQVADYFWIKAQDQARAWEEGD